MKPLLDIPAGPIIDRSMIGSQEPPLTMLVERGQLELFARSIGERDPVYSDLAAARAAGHPDLPVPPTFLFTLTLRHGEPFALITSRGVDLRLLLHGGQEFTYHAPAYAGDRLTAITRVTDVYHRKGGALEFVICDTEVTRERELIANIRATVIVRHPAKASS